MVVRSAENTKVSRPKSPQNYISKCSEPTEEVKNLGGQNPQGIQRVNQPQLYDGLQDIQMLLEQQLGLVNTHKK